MEAPLEIPCPNILQDGGACGNELDFIRKNELKCSLCRSEWALELKTFALDGRRNIFELKTILRSK